MEAVSDGPEGAEVTGNQARSQRGRGLVVGPRSRLATSLVNNLHYGSDLDLSSICPLPKRD